MHSVDNEINKRTYKDTQELEVSYLYFYLK